MAPINPTRAMRNSRIPTATATPTTRRLEMSPNPIPQAAMPISRRLTIIYSRLRTHKEFLEQVKPPHTMLAAGKFQAPPVVMSWARQGGRLRV